MSSMESRSGLYLQRPLQLPASLTSWLFAAALFMEPLSGVRLGTFMSYGDCLFMISGMCGFCERVANREKIYVFRIYLLAALLLTLSYMANEFFPQSMSPSEYMRFVDFGFVNHAAGGASLLQNFSLSQVPNFKIILASVIIFPQAFLLQRAFTLGEVRCLIYIWTAGAVYGAVFTMLYCHGLFGWHQDYFWLTLHRARGLTMHPNALSGACSLAFAGLLLLFLEARPLLLRALVVAMALVTWRALNYTGSRTGIYTSLAIALAMFVLMFRDIPARLRVRLVVLATLVAAGFALFMYANGPAKPGSALWRLENGSTVSDSIRASDQEFAISQFWESPVFGHGYQWLRIAHNMYLQILHSAGLVGLAGYLMALLFPLYMVWRTRALSQDYASRLVKNALLSAIFGVLVFGWAQPNINAMYTTIPFGLLLYLSVMGTGWVRQPTHRSQLQLAAQLAD